jgi:hypothetical protein
MMDAWYDLPEQSVNIFLDGHPLTMVPQSRNFRFMDLPTHLLPIMHALVAVHVADMTAQAQRMQRTFGVGHVHSVEAIKQMRLALELAEVVGLRKREAA